MDGRHALGAGRPWLFGLTQGLAHFFQRADIGQIHVQRRHRDFVAIHRADVGLAGRGGPAAAQAEFFRGKSMEMIIGSDAGGGFDLYGRTVSRFLAAGALDRLQLTVAPVILGSGRPAISLPEISDLRDSLRPQTRRFQLGADTMIECVFHG